MADDIELIMYSRSRPCPFVNTARYVLDDLDISYQEIFIDQDEAAHQRVIQWTGFESVPTLVIARRGELTPLESPSYLEPGATPRGIDRGYMLTEPSAYQLEKWLSKHGIIATQGG